MDGLKPRRAMAEHGIDRQLAEKLEDGVQERIIWPEHNRGADDGGIGKRIADGSFAFSATADVGRR